MHCALRKKKENALIIGNIVYFGIQMNLGYHNLYQMGKLRGVGVAAQLRRREVLSWRLPGPLAGNCTCRWAIVKVAIRLLRSNILEKLE